MAEEQDKDYYVAGEDGVGKADAYSGIYSARALLDKSAERAEAAKGDVGAYSDAVGRKSNLNAGRTADARQERPASPWWPDSGTAAKGAIAHAAAQRQIEAVTNFSEAGVTRIQKGMDKLKDIVRGTDLSTIARGMAWVEKQVPEIEAHIAKQRLGSASPLSRLSASLETAGEELYTRLEDVLTGGEAPALGGKFSADDVAQAFYNERFELGNDAEADAFVRSSKALYDHLESARKALAAHDVALPEYVEKAHAALKDALKPNSTFDWASLYPSWDGDSAAYESRITKALGRAAPEVAAAQSPKSQASPARRDGGRKLNAQSTQEGDSGVRENHPITLAAERFRRHFDGGDTAVSAQAARRLQGVGRVGVAGDFPSFGVVGKPGAEAAFFTAGAPGSTHAFVVAPQHAAKVTELLRGQSPRPADQGAVRGNHRVLW